MTGTISATDWVPVQWPESWKDPGLLDLFTDTPVNCLLCSSGSPALGAAASRPAIKAIDWTKPAEHGIACAPLGTVPDLAGKTILTITGTAWPGVRLSSRKGQADSGPTGAPWVDASGWVVRLAQAQAPGKTIWLMSDPPEKDAPVRNAASYVLAIAEAQSAGAKRILTLDPDLATALAARRPEALEQWKRITDALRFFAGRHTADGYREQAALGVLSDYHGDNEFMATEVLNLGARQHLACRVLLKPAKPDFVGLKALLYVDAEPPAEPLRAQLAAFVREGGLLIGPAHCNALAGSAQPRPCEVPAYESRSLGRGRVVTPTSEWSDPWMIVADAHSIMSRRHDPVRLYNAGTLMERISISADGAKRLVQLVNYSGRPPAHPVTVGVPGRFRSARVVTMETPAGQVTKPRVRKLDTEVDMPPFAAYAEVELDGREI